VNGDISEARLPWDGQAYSVKRFGTTITDCDSEPVQTPGCIQGHGALLVLRPDDLTVAQVSDNSGALLGHAPEALLGQPVSRVLGEANAEELRRFLASEPVDRNPLYVLTLPGHNGAALDVTVHTTEGVVIVEFEATAHTATNGPDYFSLIKLTVARLQSAASLQALGDAATAEIRALTGMDRVMVYKFHDDGHGEVVAESRRPELSSWLGLHYPAADIPEPAREVFRRTWIRPLREIGAPLSELVPLAHPDTGRPLTMTHCALRATSAIHTEYLQNMGVTASLTLSIRRGEQLWGLIACHHYAGAFDLPYNTRAACELIAQIVSLQHKAAEDRDYLSRQLGFDEVRQLLVSQAEHEGGLSAMVDGPLTLLDALDAQGAALFHQERWWRVGQTPENDELERLTTDSGNSTFTRSCRRRATNATTSFRADPRVTDVAGLQCHLCARPFTRTSIYRTTMRRSTANSRPLGASRPTTRRVAVPGVPNVTRTRRRSTTSSDVHTSLGFVSSR